jgi:hypothetical protein
LVASEVDNGALMLVIVLPDMLMLDVIVALLPGGADTGKNAVSAWSVE